MVDRNFPIQANYLVPEDFISLARRIIPGAISILFGYIWQGFDRLVDQNFDVTKDDNGIEDDITYAAYCRIQDCMNPFSPFLVIHQPPETENRKLAGQPPRSDLGFRIREGNVRSHFTIEAKVIRTEGYIAPYVKEVTDNLLTCRYSTFSSEAAILGYLLSGNPERTFDAISQSLQCKLILYDSFPKRNHRLSHHKRDQSLHEHMPTNFCCHHLLIQFERSPNKKNMGADSPFNND